MTPSNKRIFSVGVLALIAIAVLVAVYGSFKSNDAYAVATSYTPVYHSSDLPGIFGGADGKTLKLDDSEQIDELEFIALPNTAFTITDTKTVNGVKVFRVTTNDVPDVTEGKGYWVDARLVKTQSTAPAERQKSLPSEETIINNMKTASGSLYVWGGNVHAGLENMLSLYKPNGTLDELTQKKWELDGVDCSGLLYEATGGYTPRNTSDLVYYGQPIDIAGETADQIVAKLKPLDLIAWKGHLMIVINNGQTIESRWDYDTSTEQPEGGVRVRDLKYVIEETLAAGKIPVNNYDDTVPEGKKKFVVRRWYQQQA